MQYKNFTYNVNLETSPEININLLPKKNMTKIIFLHKFYYVKITFVKFCKLV